MANFGKLLAMISIGMVGLLSVSASAAPGQQDGGNAEKRAYALKYLEATHANAKAEDASKRIIPNVVSSVKATHPGISAAAVEKFRRSLTARMAKNNDQLRDIQIQVLTRTFTARELKEAAAYYASPTGQHFQSVSMTLMGEIMGQRQEMFNDTIKGAMKDANIPVPKATLPAAPVPPSRPH